EPAHVGPRGDRRDRHHPDASQPAGQHPCPALRRSADRLDPAYLRRRLGERGLRRREPALLSGRRASHAADTGAPSVPTAVRANASRLRRPGAVKILSLKSATAYSLSGARGKTRLAWTVIGRLPVVQCVEVRRTGSFLSGITVTLLSISAPIAGEADC